MSGLPPIQPNSSAVAFLIVVVSLGLVTIVVLLSRYLNIWQAKRLTGIRFSVKKFKKLASAAEFTDDEQNFLENYFHSTKIPRFLEIFYDYRFGQSIMRQMYRTTYIAENSFSCDAERARYYIFNMVQKLENFLNKNFFVDSTRAIPVGTRFYLNIEKGGVDEEKDESRYVGKMSSNRLGYFEVQLLNRHLSYVLKKGSEVKIELLKEGDRAVYTCLVKGYRSNGRRKKLLVLKHGRKPAVFLGARRFKRKQLQTSATMIQTEKRGASFRDTGEAINVLLCDISMAGCGVLSHIKHPKNSYISISYINPYDNKLINFVCEIMGYTNLRNTEIDAVILQNRIEKIEFNARNLISAFVYDFENENDKVKKLIKSPNDSMYTFDDDTVSLLKSK